MMADFVEMLSPTPPNVVDKVVENYSREIYW